MAPKVLGWCKSRWKKWKRDKKLDGTAAPSGIQTPPRHIADVPVVASDVPDEQGTTSVTSHYPVPVATEHDAEYPLPAPSAPTASTALPPSADSTTSGLQSRIWNEAYDNLKKEEPELVNRYETLLSRELRDGNSRPRDETSHKNEIEQTNSETRRSQMVQLVKVGLAKTSTEAAVKHGIQEKMYVLSSVKELINTAVTLVPQAAIAWTGACFALGMLANPISETNANRDGIVYVLSKMEWYWNLSSLLLEENQVDKTAALRGELEKHIIDLYKGLLSYQMKSVCSYYRHRLIAFAGDIVKLDDWDSALQSLKDTEATIQQDCERYNTEEIKCRLEKIANAAESLAADVVPGIRQTLENMQEKEKNEKCLADLYRTNPRDDKERIEQAKGGLLKGSSNWILQHKDFQRWQNENEANMLWIKGDPGKGKTMLLIAIIDELESRSKQLKQPYQQPTTMLSYFFCQGTNSNLNSAAAVLRGLIYLLGVQSPPLVSHLRKVYDITGSKLFEGENVFISLSKVLQDMLQEDSLNEANLSKVYIAIDALDECEQGLAQLLDLITRLSSTSTRIKWIVSSRNAVGIERPLKFDNSGTILSLELTQNAQQVTDAVKAYIDFKISHVQSLEEYGQQSQVRDQVRNIMYEKSNDTFLWVALVIKELEDPETISPLSVIQDMPSDLYALYDRMMKQIQQLKNPDRYRQVLSTATLAYRPLHLAELGVLSGLEQGDSVPIDIIKRIVARCGSFLTIQNDYVYHIHQSAKDYLSGRARNEIFPSGPIHDHHVIFSRSLRAMAMLRRDIYSLRHPGCLIDEIKTPNPDPLAPIRYSCTHWINHFCDGYCSSNSEVEAVNDFLRGKFLYWLEAMSLMHSIGSATASIFKLVTFLTGKLADDQSLGLVEDSRRFILHNRWVIENAPLQAYASALLFSPTRSLIREAFKDQDPKWVQLQPVVESSWSPCLQTLEGHGNGVASVMFSSDSKLLASASWDKTVKIWDTATGSLRQTFENHSDMVTSVTLSSESKLLALGSDDKTIKVWDIVTGSLRQTLRSHSSVVCSGAFSPDSRLLASGSWDNTVKIWDTETGFLRQTFESHSNPVNSVTFSSDSKLLASGSDDKTIKVWDIVTGSLRQTLRSHSSAVCSVAFSPDFRLLASGSKDNTVKIWDTATGFLRQTFESHSNPVNSVTFSADSKLLASGSDDNTIKVWDITTGAQQTFEGHNRSVMSVILSNDNKLLASGSADRTIKIWDINTRPPKTSNHRTFVTCMVFSSDLKLLASASKDQTIKIWDTTTGSLRQTFEGHNGQVKVLALSQDSRLLASVSNFHIITIWDLATGSQQILESNIGDNLINVTFSTDSRLLAVVSYGSDIKILHLASGRHETIAGHRSACFALAFSHDSKLLAFSSSDDVISIWNLSTQSQQILKAKAEHTHWLVFSHDSVLLASMSHYNDVIEVWDVATGSCLQTLNHIRSTVLSFDYSGLSLTTSAGRIDLSIGNKAPKSSPRDSALGQIELYGYGLNLYEDWITWNGRGVLWIPPDYRPWIHDISPLASPLTPMTVTNIALGSRSGNVVIIGLSDSGPL